MNQARGIGSNVNYKIFARIKPTDTQNNMIEVNSDNN